MNTDSAINIEQGMHVIMEEKFYDIDISAWMPLRIENRQETESRDMILLILLCTS